MTAAKRELVGATRPVPRLLFALLWSLVAVPVASQERETKEASTPRIVITKNVTTKPDEAAIVYTDAENFAHAMQLVADGANLVRTLEAEYFAKGTPGLAQMVVKYPFTAEELASAIHAHPDDYTPARISATVALLKAREPQIRAAYRRYSELAPDTSFAPTYYLVDRHRGIGSGSPDGQLIAIEGNSDESIEEIETLLIHELVHFQQLCATGPDEFYSIFGPKKTLLALTIREGTAEFFADRVTGRMTQQGAVDYCLANEEDVWMRFLDRMFDEDTAGWMWSAPANPSVPRDLAYVFGARIVEAFYEGAEDKRNAVREILAVTDYEDFLDRSRYGDRF